MGSMGLVSSVYIYNINTYIYHKKSSISRVAKFTKYMDPVKRSSLKQKLVGGFNPFEKY